jgi:MFS transporter, putative metabolite:H+ symporter
MTHTHSRSIFNIAVIVASLGYFVDIYDLILFSIVRVPSLTSLGLPPAEVTSKGLLLLNIQMAGMLIGGIVWGVLGDKKGRLQLLFGSIFIYSLANIANGFVTSFEWYAIWRLIAGIGLAGELGGGVTLVTEIMPKEMRGYGTMIISTVGVSGAVLAYNITEHFDWRTAFFIGGGLGIVLLFLRFSVFESSLFEAIRTKQIERGNFFSLFTQWKRFTRYLKCIFIGLPSWFVVGILITLAPELTTALGIEGQISAGRAVMFVYLGLIPGDFISGVTSQLLKSRTKIVLYFLIANAVCTIWYFLAGGSSANHFYLICFFLGFTTGYWAVFVTIAAEQFGTNLRATVATTVPNMARGAVVPISILFTIAKSYFGILGGAMTVGVICMATALFALFHLEETFGKDLNYHEE